MNATTQDLPAADQQFSLSRFDQTRHIGRRPVTLASLGQVLRWRWKMVLAVAGLMTLAGAIFALVLTPRYQSTAKIRITPVGALPTVMDDARDQPLDQALVNTEIATIRSRDVARKVVEQNGLGQDAEFVAARLRVGQTDADRARATEAAITSLMERLSVEQQEKSYVLAISVSSQDGAKAARLANGFAGSYIDKTADVLMSTAARQAASGQAALERLSAQAEGAAASVAQYRAATNMTDRQGALMVLCGLDTPLRAEKLADFHARYEGNALVTDKWFSLQAGSLHRDVLAHVKALAGHGDFTMTNPNRVRALYMALAVNPAGFHDASGEGYRMIGDLILALDPINAQTAARFVPPLGRWRKMEPVRGGMMKAQLERILVANGLSKDTFEQVSKSLG